MGRKIFSGFCIAGLLVCAASLHAQSGMAGLEKSFQSPPNDARIMMRWWWFGPAVTKPELERELEEMKAGGIGGFEIQPVYPLELDDPETGFRNLPYLSDDFLDDVRFVNQQAHRLGLRANLTLASGWPYGGPHTPVTEASCMLRLVQSVADAATGSVAVPHLENGEALVAAFLADPNWKSGDSQRKPAMLPLPPPGAVRMNLPPDTPAGSVVLWFLSSRTGQQVKRAAVGAEGFVLDHFSHQAVADHLRNVADKLITAFDNEPPYSVFSDSLEVYEADWTPDFLAEFRRRRGYDLAPHLPELFTSKPDEEALEVRHDWGITLTELIDENYLQQINTWANAHHTLFRSQSYGYPAVSLSSNALVALPEGEGPQWRQFSTTRWATSASHLYGRPITSSETWTWLHSPTFRATPLDMKAEADRFFLQGINQLMGHGWPYSPPSAGEPGWRFYAAAVFNTHNPWWIVMPDITRYMQRVSWILRQGQPANDIAIYLPEEDAWSDFTPGKASVSALMPHWITPALTQAVEDAGYNFDYIDGSAIDARGIHYRLLILPNVHRISPETLAQIRQYVARGGKVIALGQLPQQAPGFLHHGAESAQVASAVHALFDQGNSGGNARFLPNVNALGPLLHEMTPPDLQLSPAAPLVGFIHRKLENADVYFIANTSNVPVKTSAHFRAARNAGEWLDADSGASRAAELENGTVELDLAPYESRVLLVHAGESKATAAPLSQERILSDLSRDWRATFDATSMTERMPDLVSWTANPKTLYYSGIVTYSRTIEWPRSLPRGEQLLLDFGEGTPLPEPAAAAHAHGTSALLDPPIREAAVVYINGTRAGSLWHPPYRIDVTRLLEPGENTIEIHVANTAINLLAGEDLPTYRLLWARYGQRFVPQDMENLQPLPSGLMGKVQLIGRSELSRKP